MKRDLPSDSFHTAGACKANNPIHSQNVATTAVSTRRIANINPEAHHACQGPFEKKKAGFPDERSETILRLRLVCAQALVGARHGFRGALKYNPPNENNRDTSWACLAMASVSVPSFQA
jgi:hypothetical protein